jgi:hypothetical protein
MRIPFCLSFFFISLVTFAQDSIPAGVIKVQRKPVEPAYRAQMFVMYGDSTSRTRITDFSLNQIVISDSGYDARAPMPMYNVESRLDGPHAFNWRESLKEIHYQFAWADTSRYDSARFVYYIDKHGIATCQPLPWVKADSTTRKFEKMALPYMTSLRFWSPANKVKRSRRQLDRAPKTKPVASYVTIIIYAYDPNKGRLLPLEIIPNDH